MALAQEDQQSASDSTFRSMDNTFEENPMASMQDNGT